MSATFVNELHVTGDLEEFHRISDGLSAYMRRQPGYLGHRMLRSLHRPDVYLEIAEWYDADSHLAAVRSEGFRSRVVEMVSVVDKPTPDVYELVGQGHPGEEAVA
ncbi:antibiotic biosynthesis monooxygenase family protein [Kineococcus sp. NPDC059986]|uniref:antibiotic biosynthesis monooxygenase family protein n=1 Tax=Kineococcus sp. NPDC059986 TaxID=3155538 RepID=UPI00344BD1B1